MFPVVRVYRVEVLRMSEKAHFCRVLVYLDAHAGMTLTQKFSLNLVGIAQPTLGARTRQGSAHTIAHLSFSPFSLPLTRPPMQIRHHRMASILPVCVYPRRRYASLLQYGVVPVERGVLGADDGIAGLRRAFGLQSCHLTAADASRFVGASRNV